MKSNLRRLGDYIQEVDVRNRNHAVTNLKGLSIEKIFIESIANTIGTDLSNYKVVKPRQFAYVPVTSRNGEKITVALYEGEMDCIISQAYTAFEIIDEEELMPEYLMMWFRRSEFDRYARFHSHGSAREIFDWEEMCNVMLPVPPIEEQRAIVARHKAIEDKIATNRALISTLEDTARTIYRHKFFDDIDPENLLNGWEKHYLSEIVESNDENLSSKDKFDTIRYYETSSVTNNVFETPTELIIGEDEIPSRAKRKVKVNDIIYSTVRPNLKHYGLVQDESTNNIVSTGFAVLRSKVPFVKNEFIFLFLTMENNTQKLQELADMSKATYPSITIDDILNLSIILPAIWTDELVDAQENIVTIFNHIRILIKENELLNNLLTYERI